jgi:predicted thioesterase
VTTTVSTSDTAISLGSGDLPVLGTPRVAALMEAAAVSALAGRLDAGLTTVGVHIDIRHMAPTPIGAEVRAEASVTGVHGGQVSFELTATSGVREIARGRHVRVVVDRQTFLDRIEGR